MINESACQQLLSNAEEDEKKLAKYEKALEYYAKGNFPSYTKEGVRPGTVARQALADTKEVSGENNVAME